MSDAVGARSVAARRPVILSIVTILMMIGGIISIVTGVIAFALRNDADVRAEINETPGTTATIGVLLIISGLISIALAVALRRGSRVARTIVAVYEVLHIVAAVIALIRLDHGTYLVSTLVSIALAGLVLYYLYGTQGSKAFFGDNTQLT